MDPRLQRRVQRYGWDRAAGHYEAGWKAQLAPAQTRLLDMAALQPGERVLDVACGTGLVTLPAARAVGPEGEVVATDISDEMVRLVGEAFAREGLTNGRFLRMDAEDLKFEDGSFDAVICALGLMYPPDPIQSLREMLRVLRPGGRAVSAIWGARKNCGWAGIFPVVDARVESDVCPLFFQLGTGDSLRMAMEEAGFERIEIDRITTTLHYPDEPAALVAAFDGGPVAMAYARFDENTRQEVHAEYLETIAPYRKGEAYEIPGEFVVGIGWKAD